MNKGRSLIALTAGAAMALLVSSAGAAVSGNHSPTAAGPQVVKYPMDAQRAGEEGTVSIKVYVSVSGRINKAQLVRSSGIDRLDNAAVESVLGWKFNPAEEGGKAVDGYTVVQVVYKVPAPGASQ